MFSEYFAMFLVPQQVVKSGWDLVLALVYIKNSTIKIKVITNNISKCQMNILRIFHLINSHFLFHPATILLHYRGGQIFLLGHFESNILRVDIYTNCWHFAAVYFILVTTFTSRKTLSGSQGLRVYCSRSQQHPALPVAG